jgi:hypothetical protein
MRVDGGGVERGRLLVAHEQALVGARHAEAEGAWGRSAARASRHGLRRGPRIVVLGVEAGQHLVHQGRAGQVGGEHADAVQRAAGGNQAARAPAALGGLEADQVVERGRHPARAGGVGAQREGHQPRRHGDRRAGAGAAADIGLVEHAQRRAIGAADPDQAGGELVEIGLADQHGAGRDQPLDHGRRALGRIGEGRAGGAGRQAGDVDIVLHRERHAGQGQGLAGRDPGVDGAGLGQDGLGGQRRIQAWGWIRS